MRGGSDSSSSSSKPSTPKPWQSSKASTPSAYSGMDPAFTAVGSNSTLSQGINSIPFANKSRNNDQWLHDTAESLVDLFKNQGFLSYQLIAGDHGVMGQLSLTISKSGITFGRGFGPGKGFSNSLTGGLYTDSYDGLNVEFAGDVAVRGPFGIGTNIGYNPASGKKYGNVGAGLTWGKGFILIGPVWYTTWSWDDIYSHF